jgi:hypothetical protein
MKPTQAGSQTSSKMSQSHYWARKGVAVQSDLTEFTTMRQLAMRFRGLFRGGSLEKQDDWLRDAFSCGM